MTIRGAAWARENRIAAGVLAVAVCIVILWTAFALTPSSYSGVLASIGVEDTGLIAGQARLIRVDEWAVWTPFFQAAVRNNFERFNRTSFYHEDLRNMNALPLRDWGIVFKPQLWAFFVLPPANAYGFYFGTLMAAFLAGYFLLFRELTIGPEYAMAGSVLLFCCGFSQFWWTTLGPSLSFFPWVALVILRPWPRFVRLPLTVYAITAWVIAHPYLLMILTCGMAFVLLVAGLRSETLRSPKRLAVTGVAAALAAGLIYFYFADALRGLDQTLYPGRRFAPPGTVPIAILISQFWPAFSFTARDFRNLAGVNICEIGVVGSFFPVWTICALDFAGLKRSLVDPASRRLGWALGPLAAGFALSWWWMAGQCPVWIGRLLLWNRFPAQRLQYLPGLLLLSGCLILWQRGLVKVTPFRAAIFVIAGPLASIAVKMAVFGAPTVTKVDWLCAVLAAAGAVAAFQVNGPQFDRQRAAGFMLASIVAINVVLFLPFNPLQSAEPIFDAPDSNTVELLQAQQAQTPGGYLAVEGYRGAILNGLGFKSVSHVLIHPHPEFFRQYFPHMDGETFNYVFNRYAAIALKEVPLPHAKDLDTIEIPTEVFRPIQNLRRAVIEAGEGGCPAARESVNTFGLSLHNDGAETTIEGWAPWIGESSSQHLFIRTKRPIQVRSLTTVQRLDIADSVHNYQMEKAGFRLVLSAQDRLPLSLNELRIAADGTTGERMWIDGCTAP